MNEFKYFAEKIHIYKFHAVFTNRSAQLICMDGENMDTKHLCQNIGIQSNIIEKIENIRPMWVRDHQPDIYWIKFFILQDADSTENLVSHKSIELEKIGLTKESATEFCNWIKGIELYEHQCLSYWLDMYLENKYMTPLLITCFSMAYFDSNAFSG